jgi:hypothetical protein
MKDFANASFPPEIMTVAMNSAPLHFRIRSVQRMFNPWLRQFCARKYGKRDPKALERMALLELQISSRTSLLPDRV